MLIDYVVHTTSEAKQIAGETGVTHEEKNLYFDTYNSLTPNWYYKVLR